MCVLCCAVLAEISCAVVCPALSLGAQCSAVLPVPSVIGKLRKVPQAPALPQGRNSEASWTAEAPWTLQTATFTTQHSAGAPLAAGAQRRTQVHAPQKLSKPEVLYIRRFLEPFQNRSRRPARRLASSLCRAGPHHWKTVLLRASPQRPALTVGRSPCPPRNSPNQHFPW